MNEPPDTSPSSAYTLASKLAAILANIINTIPDKQQRLAILNTITSSCCPNCASTHPNCHRSVKDE